MAGAPQLLAVGGAAGLAVYLLNRDGNSRLVKALSGTIPPDSGANDTEPLLKRRPSWEAKFVGNGVPEEVKKELNDAAKSRLERRPSYAMRRIKLSLSLMCRFLPLMTIIALSGGRASSRSPSSGSGRRRTRPKCECKP